MFDSPWLAVALGSLMIVLLVVALARTHKPILGVAIVVVLAGTIGMVILERQVITDRERIEQLIRDSAAAVEADDVPRVLAAIDPQNRALRGRASGKLGQARVRDLRITSLGISIFDHTAPRTAEVDVTVRFNVRGGANQFDNQIARARLNLFQDTDTTWLVEDYEPLNLIEK